MCLGSCSRQSIESRKWLTWALQIRPEYDLVCNGVELSSGAIRNHVPDIMYKAFEIAGFQEAEIDISSQF